MKKQQFEKPFIGTDTQGGCTLLYTANGSFSAIMEVRNLAVQYCADPSLYEAYSSLFGQLVKLLGAGFSLQKTDIIAKNRYAPEIKPGMEYLDKKYFKHFEGRPFTNITTYLTITKQNSKGRFFAYSQEEVKDFRLKVQKAEDLFESNGIKARLLDAAGIADLHKRYLAFNFNDGEYAFTNISADETGLTFGGKQLKVISLIDIDELNIPNTVTGHQSRNGIGNDFPTDNFSFLLNVPGADTVLYSQNIFIPDQIKVKRDLELKKKRHSSMPDPANGLAVKDIDDMFTDIAKENELLVYCHFSILILADKQQISKSVNYIETNLFGLGIIPGRNAYNQLELFRAAIPGNAGELKQYDRFLTSRLAATCFFFKEALPKGEQSDYLLYFTDRQGIPIGIDTSELPMHTNRISNRNKFILGPSGTGKSFFTNRYVKQCRVLGADVILVDTGHSYLGLCNYFKGKYITYREDKPVSMNPFKIELVENNEEKRQILKSLIGMLWKGTEGTLSQVEDTVLSKCVSDYFAGYFKENKTVHTLNFNSFFEFSCSLIADIIEKEKIRFHLNEYRFILQKFYRGGEYERILNDDFDNTLFNESFIVFEIDSIKEHKLLFPITTLIIMDVFIQKMRFKKNKKILIIEEAWKAIASPMMAGYILYLYKTVRKFAGEAIVVTQELGDIIGNPIVKDSIIANSDTVCLLDQSKFRDNFGQIAQLLSLNAIETNKILTVNKLDNKEGRSRFKEVYIRRGAVGEVYGVEVPLEEYLTYTTERAEKEAVEVYLNHCGSYETALDSFVNDLKKSGLSLPQFVKHTNTTEKVYSV